MKDESMLSHRSISSSRLRGAVLAVAVLTAATLAVSGCGPIKSTQRIGQAEVALERARVVEAYRKAPYEFFSARYYVHKAKEEWGYSDFEASFDYADDAKDDAEAAIRKAEEDPWEDPLEGRNKTYKLKPRQTISVDAEEIEEAEDFSGSDPEQAAEPAPDSEAEGGEGSESETDAKPGSESDSESESETDADF